MFKRVYFCGKMDGFDVVQSFAFLAHCDMISFFSIWISGEVFGPEQLQRMRDTAQWLRARSSVDDPNMIALANRENLNQINAENQLKSTESLPEPPNLSIGRRYQRRHGGHGGKLAAPFAIHSKLISRPRRHGKNSHNSINYILTYLEKLQRPGQEQEPQALGRSTSWSPHSDLF